MDFYFDLLNIENITFFNLDTSIGKTIEHIEYLNRKETGEKLVCIMFTDKSRYIIPTSFGKEINVFITSKQAEKTNFFSKKEKIFLLEKSQERLKRIQEEDLEYKYKLYLKYKKELEENNII